MTPDDLRVKAAKDDPLDPHEILTAIEAVKIMEAAIKFEVHRALLERPQAEIVAGVDAERARCLRVAKLHYPRLSNQQIGRDMAQQIAIRIANGYNPRDEYVKEDLTPAAQTVEVAK